MADQLAGMPFAEAIFDKKGRRLNYADPIAPAGITDLVVISHGWHQDAPDACRMYEEILRNTITGGAGLWPNREFGATGVFWPSDKFADDLRPEDVPLLTGAGFAQAGSGDDLSMAELMAYAEQVADLLGVDPETLKELAQNTANSGGGPDACDLVNFLRNALGVRVAATIDADLREEHSEFLQSSGSDIFDALRPAGMGGSAGNYGVVGAAMAVRDDTGGGAAANIFGGPVATVAKILNQAAYFELKQRAGVVGASLGQLLDKVRDIERIHLVGHSFGARLVTAAAAAMSTNKPYSVTLLQGAFSHFALAPAGDGLPEGAFHVVVEEPKVTCRIVVTHTWNDRAVGLAYAVASRVSRDVAQGLIKVSDHFGGAQDKHGGIGANGALRLGDLNKSMVYEGDALPVLDGTLVHSLKCDFISNHTDIETAGVGRVIAAAIR